MSETADLWQPKGNENQTVLAAAIHTPTGILVSWKVQWLGAGVHGLWGNPRARAGVDCGETDRGDVREKTVVGNVCGGKPGKPWKQGDTAESRVGGGVIAMASLPDTAASAAEQ